MKKISVVIPAYNEEKYISLAINALHGQDFPVEDFEIIVVDNGSTDNTFKRAQEAKADKVVKESNKGTNWARQKGFEVAIGDIVCFLDADSIPPLNWLSHIYEVFSREENKNLGVLGGPYEYDFKGATRFVSNFIEFIFSPLISRFIETLFHKRVITIFGGNMAIKRRALEKIGGFDTSLRFWGDDSNTAFKILQSGYDGFFDRSLVVISSRRRYDNGGYFNTKIKYSWAWLKMYFKYGS